MMYLEKQILGCFLKDNTLLKDTNITKHFFQDNTNKLIYESMQKLSQEGSAVDKVTLMADNYEHLEKLGGVSFIENIEQDGDIENFPDYEKKLTEQFKKRSTESILKAWLSKDEKEVHQLLDQLQKVEELGYEEENDKNQTLMKLHDEAYQGQKTVGIPTGLESLDNLLGGFHNASSYILAARPSLGKTATMLKFVKEVAEYGAVPIVFSLEMPEESLLRRMIATIGEINLFLARNPSQLIESKKGKWQEAINHLYKLDFEIYDKAMQTIPYMRSKIRQAKKKYKGKQIVVFIDYLTLIQNEGNFNSDHAKVSDISANLKAMAKEYDCPVITLAQLSRAVEQRQDKRPMLSDIRESGSIEQDADAVLFLYRESYYNKDSDDNTLEIIVAKHRDGPTGTATVYYNKATGKIGDLSNDY